MSSLWEERAARNEALFREVNEQLKTVSDQFGTVEDGVEFVCECSSDSCVERVRVPREVYEAVREDPRRFLVLPGHEGDFEHAVVRAPTYVIVEKEGTAGRIAAQTDPRTQR
jgi:hypothetical protein